MKKLLTYLLVLGICLTNPGLVLAAEDEIPSFDLNQVIVTALRTEKTDLQTPATVTVYQEKDLKNTGARNLFDALQFTQGITNFSYGGAGQSFGSMDSRVVLRGFDRGALVLINGAPINLLNKNALESIPLESIEKVEIVKGAASTLYGAEAFGGVINIITKKDLPAKTLLTLEAGNLGYDKKTLGYQNGKISLSYSENKFDKLSRISPDRPDRGYYHNLGEGDGKNFFTTVLLSDKLTANYMHTENNSTYGQSPIDRSKVSHLQQEKSWSYNDKKDNLNLVYNDPEQKMKAVAFYNAKDLYGEARDYYKKTITPNTSNYKSYNWGLDLQKSWEVNEKGSLLAGLVYQTEHYQNTFDRSQEADRYNYALYGQYSYQVNPRFTVIVGGRQQFIKDPIKSQTVFCPQLQTVYQINDQASWYVNFGKAFQMPQLNQLFKTGAITQTDNLKPQQGWNYETGWKFIKPDSSWKLAFYYMDFKDKFDFEKQTDGTFVPVNLAKFKNQGVELEYKKKINQNWSSTLGISYSDPRNQDVKTGIWSQTFPKLQLTGGCQYQKDQLSGALSVNYLGQRPKNQYQEETDPLIAVNLNLDYRINNDNKITLAMNNLLDRNNVITHRGYEYWDLPFNYRLAWEHQF